MNRWTSHGENVRSSFWFLPTMMAIGGGLLALLTNHIDRFVVSEKLPGWWWIFNGGAGGAREVVSTVAGSMITVAGVVFSITIVTLSLTSTQFGPRLLRNFLRDRRTQAVLGCFVGTFLYCLLVLRAIRSKDEAIQEFVPNIGVAVGVLMAVAAVFVLVYFIHHTANAIRAPMLAERTSRDLLATLGRLYPEQEVKPQLPVERLPSSADEAYSEVVLAKSSGYVLEIERKPLEEFAQGFGIRIDVLKTPGKFVVPGDVLAKVRGNPRIDKAAKSRIAAAFRTGSERTLEQDPGFGFAMLVEMAVRSVSPSMNDPYTAMQCIDRMREALTFVAGRAEAGESYWRMPGFGDFLDESWEQLSFYGRTNPPVMRHMRHCLDALAEVVSRPADRAAVERWIAKSDDQD